MLHISRVPTVISLHQDDETVDAVVNKLVSKKDPPKQGTIRASCEGGEEKFAAFGFAVREDLPPPMRRTRSFGEVGDCQVPQFGSSSPNLLSLSDASSEGSGSGSESDDGAVPKQSSRSLFDSMLLNEWEDRKQRGMFRYDVNDCETKLLDGELAFVAQLNEGRASNKRPTEFRVDLVCQEFDDAKFNFNKAADTEALFAFVPAKGKHSTYSEQKNVGRAPSLLLINVSPIEYGHVLLVPRITQCLPQRIRGDVLNLAVHMALESHNPYFRIGYNSLGAYATINHLHFQAYYLGAPFPIERAKTEPIPSLSTKRARAHVQRTVNFPVRSVVYEMGANVDDLTETVANACMRLQEHNIPFNLLICDKGARIILIPNVFSERMAKGTVPEHVVDTGVNPAVFEISGHLLYKAREDYDRCTQQTAWELLEQASLTEERFQAMLKLISC